MKIVAFYNCMSLGLGVGIYFSALITHSSLVQLITGAAMMGVGMVVLILTGDKLIPATE